MVNMSKFVAMTVLDIINTAGAPLASILVITGVIGRYSEYPQPCWAPLDPDMQEYKEHKIESWTLDEYDALDPEEQD